MAYRLPTYIEGNQAGTRGLTRCASIPLLLTRQNMEVNGRGTYGKLPGFARLEIQVNFDSEVTSWQHGKHAHAP